MTLIEIHNRNNTAKLLLRHMNDILDSPLPEDRQEELMISYILALTTQFIKPEEEHFGCYARSDFGYYARSDKEIKFDDTIRKVCKAEGKESTMGLYLQGQEILSLLRRIQ